MKRLTKVVWVFFALFAGFLVLGASLVKLSAQNAQQTEIKIKVHNTPDSPHLINDIGIEGVKAGKRLYQDKRFYEARFQRDQIIDWAKNLQFTYTNMSDQEITFLNMVLVVQHPTESDLKVMPTIFTYKSGQQKHPIKPGQTINIQVEKTFFDALLAMFNENGLQDRSLIDEVTIQVYQADFGNGSMWMHEGYFDPDPNNPGQKITRPRKKISQLRDNVEKKKRITAIIRTEAASERRIC
jgi:hypothetical protein